MAHSGKGEGWSKRQSVWPRPRQPWGTEGCGCRGLCDQHRNSSRTAEPLGLSLSPPTPPRGLLHAENRHDPAHKGVTRETLGPLGAE
jgi:hypothetical protein